MNVYIFTLAAVTTSSLITYFVVSARCLTINSELVDDIREAARKMKTTHSVLCEERDSLEAARRELVEYSSSLMEAIKATNKALNKDRAEFKKLKSRQSVDGS